MKGLLRTLVSLGTSALAAAVALAALLVPAHSARAQAFSPVEYARAIDSGTVVNTTADWANPFTVEVFQEHSPWVRVRFDRQQLALAGVGRSGDQSYITITSLTDNAVQVLSAEALEQWDYTSAYFNGPIVRVQLWVPPAPPPADNAVVVDGDALPVAADASVPPTNRVVISGIIAQDPDTAQLFDLCGADDRVRSYDNRVARLISGVGGCTAWMFNDLNHTFLSAGHCMPANGSVVQFNVPLSGSDGSLTNPAPEDQYSVDGASVKSAQVGTSNDWSYFGVFPNTNTGQQPVQRYGSTFTLAAAPPAVAAPPQTIRVTGYGTVVFPFDPTFNQIQLTGTGDYTFYSTDGQYPILRYNVDTTTGNSGSPVIDLTTGLAIGIHYLAGCSVGGNQATAVNNAELLSALSIPIGVCKTGKGTVSGNFYALGDLQNNFGTVNYTISNPPATGTFAKISRVGVFWTAMAYNWNDDTFFATNTLRELWRITRAGVGTKIADITGTSGPFSGLAYNPKAGTLWGIVRSGGVMYTVNPDDGSASPWGNPIGLNVAGLVFDTTRNRLWGLTQPTASTARAFWISQSTGSVTLLASQISGVTAMGDVAFNAADGNLYTVNAATGFGYRINATTGVGTFLGTTGALWSTVNGMGLAYANARPACRPDYNNDGNLNPDDIGDYITDYFTVPQPASVDWNGDENINPDDLGDYITAYFEGC